MRLTKKQKAFLGYISSYVEDWGRSPSFKEICSHFGFTSYNTVTTYLKTLEQKGYIRLPRKKNQKRAIEVISPVETRRLEFPLLGKVAAGRPIEAVEEVDVIEIPPSMLGKGDHFVLQVKGDSMKEDGILDGDFIVVQPGHGEEILSAGRPCRTPPRPYRHEAFHHQRGRTPDRGTGRGSDKAL